MVQVSQSFRESPITEVSSQSPESKNNLLNFQNVNGIVFISLSLTFLIFHVYFFFQKSQEKLLAVRIQHLHYKILNFTLRRFIMYSKDILQTDFCSMDFLGT